MKTPKRIELFIFGGLGWPFTAGGVKRLEDLIEKLSPEWDSHVLAYWDWEKSADAVIARQKKYKDSPIVIVGGHSWGALTATWFAKRLKTYGIEVQYLFGIDPTATTNGIGFIDVPTNVRKIDEFWSSSPLFNFPYWARRSAPDGSKGGMFKIPDSLASVHDLFKVPSGHIASARHEITVERIVEQISNITK